MARRKSIKKCAKTFQTDADAVLTFADYTATNLSKTYATWAFEYAIIRLYRDFEDLILNSLKGAINNNPTTLSTTTGITFPNSLSDAVCEYLIVGGGYFDFKGRDGLIKTLKKFVPDEHYLVTCVKKNEYKSAIDRLCALRNYAAHDSEVSRTRAKEAVNQTSIVQAGAWLKSQGRFKEIVDKLKELAAEIESAAPY